MLDRLEQYLLEQFPPDPTGHDWPHFNRVRNNALLIADKEGGDSLVIELGALLHDVSDHKFNGGILNQNGQKAKKLLEKFDFPNELITTVVPLLDSISFKGKNHVDQSLPLEAQIIQDADRLDAIGAIGIARAFAYGGLNERLMFDSSIYPKNHQSFAEYAGDKSHTINHFYEKLLLLKDKLNTFTAKQMAEDRHNLLVHFLESFLEEWSIGENNKELNSWSIMR